ncbi:MAG: hypothetical protein UW84_C0046G0001 [Candidatus Collierbacteria bacterium GW2011_GWA2_44_99]|uniref:Uncharacterized protein n=1 Tax=Candidatus Collierbacteria bacterium GW2011_GWA2_44_99 TaxID=1618380 RepID=A0A0G1MVS6_9BACT|nr:MAG: hypothetical protein UW84_C0046G0001 [Candidatus Collierbacteria bacterium GW2011_GWA2_44_99]
MVALVGVISNEINGLGEKILINFLPRLNFLTLF